MRLNYELSSLLKRSFLTLGFIALSIFNVHSFAFKEETSHRKPLPQAIKKSVILALQANEELHQSFFNYNATNIKSKAIKLKEAIESIEDSEISKLLKFSTIKLHQISQSDDKDSNNQNYHIVSMALIHIINKFDVGPKYNAYSCPMVKKKWIQNSSKMAKVHNPYAPSMPHCGSKDSSH